MRMDASARADLIGCEGQLGLFRLGPWRPDGGPLVWRDPPPDRRVVLTPAIIEALRGCRGRWAVVREYRNLTATRGWGRRVKHPVDIELRGVAELPGSLLYARARPPRDAG